MGRGRVLGMVLAGLVWLWAGPVLAAPIQKVVDSQGVIRITNVKPRAASVPEPAAHPAPEEKPASQSTPHAAAPLPPAPPAPAPHPDSTHVSPGPKETFSPENGNQAAPLPITKAAFSSPRLTVPAAASPPEVATTAGGIRKHRDAQGVWHIDNVSPEPPAAPGPPPPESPAVTASTPPEKALPEPAPGQTSLAITRAGWDDVLPSPPRGYPSETAAIRRFRDRRGVLIITNLAELPEPPARMVQQALARALSPRDAASLKPPGAAPALAQAPLMITRTSWEERAPPEDNPLPQEPASPPLFGVPGQIKRYRDSRGVWHIHSVEPALPPLPPAPRTRPPGLISLALAAPPPQPGVLPNSAPPAPHGGQVVAYKDKQGRLVIRNPDPHQALAARGPPTGVPPPYLQAIILEAAQAFQLPVPLIQAVIKVESNAVPWAVSPKGAMGLMQLMPGTAAFLRVKDPFCPRENVLGGCLYLRLLLNLFRQDLPLALAAYNAGYQRVINSGYQVPDIKETQEFVTQIMGRYYLALKQASQPRL